MAASRAILTRSSARWCVVLPLLLYSVATTLLAQAVNLHDPRILDKFQPTYATTPGTGVLIFRLFSEHSSIHLDRQALLKLVNIKNQSTMWQTTDDSSQGVFTNVPYGDFEVEVSAVGYLSTHKEISVMNSFGQQEIEIILKRDPSAVTLDVVGGIMSPKARKQAKHAVSMLKSGNLNGAQQRLEEAYKLSPSSPDLNFLLGYLYFQKQDFKQAGNYLGMAATLNPNHAQALTLLGRTGLERRDYPAARSALEQAIVVDAENWLPHGLLADAYLRERNYDKARDQAQIALAIGKSQAIPSRLTLGQALVGLGQNEDGIRELNAFLQESPQYVMAAQLRAMIGEISAHTSAPETPSSSNTETPVVNTMAAIPPPALNMKPWRPPGVDDLKPAVAPDAVCPAAEVIEESGKRVEELVDDVARFAAVEDLFHQSLDSYGIPTRSETRKYNYVAAISEPEPGSLAVDEYRAEKLTLQGYPDQIASTGFAALALVFHPHMRDNFEMNCEGLGDWHGQASWLVHFRQREDRPNRMHSYKVGNDTHKVALKGRAWITADKFQIVRMEADMVKPMPEIQLLSEHQLVEYGPVAFAKKNTTLWLPKSAEIYFDFRKHRYYRRHSFDHYMLFAVDTEEKRKVPVADPVGEDHSKQPSLK